MQNNLVTIIAHRLREIFILVRKSNSLLLPNANVHYMTGSNDCVQEPEGACGGSGQQGDGLQAAPSHQDDQAQEHLRRLCRPLCQAAQILFQVKRGGGRG